MKIIRRDLISKLGLLFLMLFALPVYILIRLMGDITKASKKEHIIKDVNTAPNDDEGRLTDDGAPPPVAKV